MSEHRIKTLLKELLSELEQTSTVDQETLALTRKLETDINELVDAEAQSAGNTVLDDAIALEASFAVNHPVAEKIIRELINNLSRIGI
ncbi:MAG: DUF4404 family protein [Pseudohongiellaceae bacterium]